MEIITDRLRLREYTREDWHAVLTYQRQPLYLRYYPWEERTEQDVRRFVQMFLDWQQERPRYRYQFAIVTFNDARLIGSCGIRLKSPDSREADMGYELDPEYWGKGLATEAARALLNFGFHGLGMHRISATCIAENISSIRVLERIGMRCEGRLRENEWMKDRWWDTLLYGILEDEWRSVSSPSENGL